MAFNTIDTLYADGDLLIAKIKECNEAMPFLIEHTKQVNNGTKSFLDCLSTTSFAICFAITIIALLLALTFFIFHCQNNRRQAEKDKNDYMREKESKKVSIKVEYQKRALDYLEKNNGKIEKDDVFMTTIKAYLDAIDSDVDREDKHIDSLES